jgi:hypothetical protein
MYSQFQAAEPPPGWIGNVPGSQKILGMWDNGLQKDIDNEDLFTTPLREWFDEELTHCSLQKLISVFQTLCQRDYELIQKLDDLHRLYYSVDESEQEKFTQQVKPYVHRLTHSLINSKITTPLGNQRQWTYVDVFVNLFPNFIYDGFQFAEMQDDNYEQQINRELIRHGAIVNVDGGNISYNGHTKAISIKCSTLNVPTCIQKIQQYWNFWGCSSLNITSLENNQACFDDNDLKYLLSKEPTLQYSGLPPVETPPCIIKIENTEISWNGIRLLIDWVTNFPDKTRVALDITLQDGISMTLNLPQ